MERFPIHTVLRARSSGALSVNEEPGQSFVRAALVFTITVMGSGVAGAGQHQVRSPGSFFAISKLALESVPEGAEIILLAAPKAIPVDYGCNA